MVVQIGNGPRYETRWTVAVSTAPNDSRATINVMTTHAIQPSEAERVYALGLDRLEGGDQIGASRLIWEAAANAMETYADSRGWEPDNRRYYEDIAAFRRQEMAVNIDEDPLYEGFVSAIMLAENAIDRGALCSDRMVEAYARAVASLIKGFRLDP